VADTPSFSGWAIVEVMGHRRLAGYVSEQPIAGAALVRVDVPATDGDAPDVYGGDPRGTPGYTQMIGVQSIYALTPCDEATACKAARQLERTKLPYQPRALAAGARDEDAELLDDPEDDERPF
jgi:hypothetical protein